MTVADSAAEALWPQPQPDPDTAGFWQATSQGRLAMCRCRICEYWMHPPLERCRRCSGLTDFAAVSRSGTLHSWIGVNRQSVPGQRIPYQIGLAELAEQPGLRLPGIIIAAANNSLRVGMPITIGLQSVPGGEFVAPVIHPLTRHTDGAPHGG